MDKAMAKELVKDLNQLNDINRDEIKRAVKSLLENQEQFESDVESFSNCSH